MYIRTARPTRRGRGVVVGLIAGAIALAPAFGTGIAYAAPTDSPLPPVTTVTPAPEGPAQSQQTASQSAPVKEAPAPPAPSQAPVVDAPLPKVEPPAPPRKAPDPAPTQETVAPAPAPVTTTVKEAPVTASSPASTLAPTSTAQPAPVTKAPETTPTQAPVSTAAPTSATPTSAPASTPSATQDKPKVSETPSSEAPAPPAEHPSTTEAVVPSAVTPGTSSEAPVTTTPVTSAPVSSPSTSAIPAVNNPSVVRTPDPIPEKVSDDAIKKARDATPEEVTPPVASQDQLSALQDAVVNARKPHDDNHTSTTPSSSTSVTPTTTTSAGHHHDGDDDHWDGRVHPWQWVRYDDWHRPVIYNPYNNPYDFVYYDGPDRHVVRVNPGVSVSVTVINNGVFSFTAVQVNAFGIAVNVAVGSWYVPPPNVPYVPPPVYQNVNVYYTQVNVTVNQYRYVPVHSITDCGVDWGHRGLNRVLYNGTSVGWGTWGNDDRGNRIFNAVDYDAVPGITDQGRGVPDELLSLAGSQTPLNGAPSDSGVNGLLVGILAGVGVLLVGTAIGVPLWRRFGPRRAGE